MQQADDLLERARRGDQLAFRALVSPYQRELRAYCYRMAGSLAEAEDFLQESMLRAWRAIGAFEGRSSLRTWLYKVTWSACMDALEKAGPRALATDLGPPADPRDPIPAPRDEGWIGPCPPSVYADDAPSPEARYTSRESVALAFLAALQLLTPKQRAMLLARDVLGMSAEECAEMLDSTVPSVNSALQRARETLEERAARWRPTPPDEETTRALLSRYVDAWQRADVTALTSLLREDATLSMPPFTIWLQGPAAIGASIRGMVLPPEARDTFRLVVTEANGAPALAAYRKDENGVFAATAIHVLSIDGERIRDITAFLDPRLFSAFGLPPVLAE